MKSIPLKTARNPPPTFKCLADSHFRISKTPNGHQNGQLKSNPPEFPPNPPESGGTLFFLESPCAILKGAHESEIPSCAAW